MTTQLPASARLAWWGTAWLRGHVVTDLVVDAVLGDDATHAVAGLPGAAGTETLVAALGRLRAEGATSLGAAFPAEGDPVGLGGPGAFNADALEAGEAVVVAGAELGLVPWRTGAAITWTAHPAARRQLPDVGEADRALRAALVDSANDLARLDVARWRPEVADELLNLRHRSPVVAPEGTPSRCVELAARALQALGIAELALEDDGGAVSASEIAAREAALRPLARAGRRALVAACSPEVWPD
ncbi:hypothetical protein ASC77_00610 [Nocardioides sp. Root1257]|uniref:hypothetical protein n=1 Tax=unclassified Nocardioides TaxID=2615069 RepID=UPI0006FDD731|nr:MULTISPECIES: hypothetical protein [unclassified Nocardioides]KQW52856.1 hypothetical protein ASC77_00610 [Nocardioides sp. Root1257]KRC55544.1 hypothetical protein ASE24_00610 [Nocardioides sp. Root224]